MNKKENTHRERIPYQEWANSQLSIAKHYGGININGIYYVLDYDNCPTKIIENEIKYFPDLVLFSSLPKKTNIKNPKKTNEDFSIMKLFEK